MTSAKIILHSVNPDGVELITWAWTYWRPIHSEFMTHRAFSRNAASSRAIPVERMLQAIVDDCGAPILWGANQAGMQASTVLEGPALEEAQQEWQFAAWDALRHAEELARLGAHKQIANRGVEPYSHITSLVTMTKPGLVHFFGLRAHKDAQPEFQVLAFRALDAYLKSTPTRVEWNEWHVPFGSQMPAPGEMPCRCRGFLYGCLDCQTVRLKIATARCARVSYLNFDGKIDPQKDLALFDKLRSSDPAHASAFEHCAQARGDVRPSSFSNFDTGFGGTSCGWLQFRKTIPKEFSGRLDLHEIMARKPEWVTLEADTPRPLAARESETFGPPTP